MKSPVKVKLQLLALGVSIVFFLLVCVRTGYYAFNLYLIANGAERLTCDLDDYDLGDVAQAERPEHVFRITNTGKTTVPIQSVHPSCSACVEVKECSLDPLKPGETREITVVLLTENLVGDVRKSAVVKYGKLTQQYLPLYLTAHVLDSNEMSQRQGNDDSTTED
ncbi:MAG: DUF1573 domain-containing protein [Planctomycetia bacterium]|nr:DUF1573 domain-containing protein [Planctomycetia bacterium]